jgi:hypothetical protein
MVMVQRSGVKEGALSDLESAEEVQKDAMLTRTGQVTSPTMKVGLLNDSGVFPMVYIGT